MPFFNYSFLLFCSLTLAFVTLLCTYSIHFYSSQGHSLEITLLSWINNRFLPVHSRCFLTIGTIELIISYSYIYPTRFTQISIHQLFTHSHLYIVALIHCPVQFLIFTSLYFYASSIFNFSILASQQLSTYLLSARRLQSTHTHTRLQSCCLHPFSHPCFSLSQALKLTWVSCSHLRSMPRRTSTSMPRSALHNFLAMVSSKPVVLPPQHL